MAVMSDSARVCRLDLPRYTQLSKKERSMQEIMRGLCGFRMLALCSLVAALLAALLPATPAAALDVMLARKCLDITLKAMPRPRNWTPYRAGNPTTALARPAYYRDCIARDGKIADRQVGPHGAEAAAHPRLSAS